MTIKENNKQQLKIFTENVKLLRQKASLNQSQMAELLNISIYSLRKLESGIIPERLSVEVAVRLMSVFKTNPFKPIEKQFLQ